MHAAHAETGRREVPGARRHQRHATFQDVIITGGAIPGRVARLVELSESGALLTDIDTCGLADGSHLTLMLIDGTELDARIVRRGEQTAVEFDLYLLDADEYLHFDHLGADAFRRIANMQFQRFIASATRLQKA